MNGDINDLRSNLNAERNQQASLHSKNRELSVLLDECLNKKPVIQQVIETSSTRMLESVVSFRQGKSTIDNSQLPNVERIGMYMKRHNEAKVVIKGFASPEGALELNERLALARAYAVKNMLIKKYGISSERILAQGEGVGNMYSDPDWNRVSICTIKEESK